MPSTADELRETGRLAAETGAWFAGAIGRTHLAIAQRAFVGGGPAKAIHDGIAREVYAAVGAGLATGARVAGTVAALHAANAERTTMAREGSLSDHAHATGADDGTVARRGSLSDHAHATSAGGREPAPATYLRAVLNAYAGDRLHARRSPLATRMAIHEDGRAVPATHVGLRGAFPEATDHVVVFLHGLGETELAWRGRHGAALNARLGATPIHVRINTGLRVAENGRLLSELLDDVAAAWPVPLHRIDLVGHSMGGLIARCAAERPNAAWTVLLRHIACLGTPHTGAPLEKGAELAARGLARVPELRPVAEAFRARSAGIRDLRKGDCWPPADLPRHVRVSALSASLLDSHTHPVSHVLGDLLVRHDSAQGTTLSFERRAHTGRVNHFGLLTHPAVTRWLVATLGEPRLLERRTS